MAKTRVHNQKNYTLQVGSVDLESFGPDAGVKITKVSDAIDSEYGSDGDVTMWNLNDPRYEIEVTLGCKSPSNTILSGFYQANLLATDGTAFFTSLAKETGTNTKFSARLCAVKTLPVPNIKESPETHVWTILCFDGQMFLDGRDAL